MFLDAFTKTIVGVDFLEESCVCVRGRRFFKKAFLENVSIFPANEKVPFKIADYDYVVSSANMDYIIFLSTELPEKAKRKEIEKIGRMEASRSYDLPPEEIFSTLVGRVEDKGIFAVSRKETILTQVIDKLKEIGVGEPDVIIPDVFKYFYIYEIPTLGKVIVTVANFYKNYVSNILVCDNRICGIRTSFMELSRIFSYVHENFGVDLRRLEEPYSGEERMERLISEEFSDLILEIVREISLLLNDSLVPVTQDNIDALMVIADPGSLYVSLEKAFENSGINIPIVEADYRNFINIMKKDMVGIKGSVGLFTRGVLDVGKVKSISIKKEKS